MERGNEPDLRQKVPSLLLPVQGKLQGVPVLELPTDRTYPAGGLSSAGDTATVMVPPETAAALRQLTSACNTTLYTTLLTAWKVGTHASPPKSCPCSSGIMCCQCACTALPTWPL